MSHPFASLACRALVPLVALSALACDAATLRVPSQYPTIQGAVDASRPGDTILVAPGTYVGSVRMRDKGGLTLESEAGAESTIIDGANDYRVIDISAPIDSRSINYRIAGFTVRNGRDGGIYSYGARTIIENNVLTGNRTSLHEDNDGTIRMQENGGRVFNNWIEGNLSPGIEVLQPHHTVVEGNHFENNFGGGIYVYGGDRERPGIAARLVRNVIKGNAFGPDFSLSGLMRAEAADNLVIRSPESYDRSVYIYGTLTGRFINNTIVATTGHAPLVAFSESLAGLAFANNIIYSGADAPALSCDRLWEPMEMVHHNDAFSASGTPIAGDDCIEAFTQGEGNVSVDPVFTQGEGGSMWQLDPDSPLIDQGDNKVVKQLRRDIRGVPRIVDGGLGPVVDMGAFEYLPK